MLSVTFVKSFLSFVHRAPMQRHVAALNAFTGQGFERGEVLRQAYAADDLRELASRGDAKDAQGEAGAGMDLQGPAYGTHGHGHG